MHYLLMCRSMTAAQRTVRTLQRGGIFASVTKAPQSANPGGCTYGAKIGGHNLEAARAVLRAAGIEPIKILKLLPDGSVGEAGV